jgi:hypothetical protein
MGTHVAPNPVAGAAEQEVVLVDRRGTRHGARVERVRDLWSLFVRA